MQIQINYGASTMQYDNNGNYNTPFTFRSVSDIIIEMSLKTDNVMTTISTMDFLFFCFYLIFFLSIIENELQKSHFDHKNLLFAFHEIKFNFHVRKIYFKTHINDNNDGDLDFDSLN